MRFPRRRRSLSKVKVFEKCWLSHTDRCTLTKEGPGSALAQTSVIRYRTCYGKQQRERWYSRVRGPAALTGRRHHAFWLNHNTFWLVGALSLPVHPLVLSFPFFLSTQQKLCSFFPYDAHRKTNNHIWSYIWSRIDFLSRRRANCLLWGTEARDEAFFFPSSFWTTMGDGEDNLQSSLLFYTPLTDKSKFHYAN